MQRGSGVYYRGMVLSWMVQMSTYPSTLPIHQNLGAFQRLSFFMSI